MTFSRVLASFSFMKFEICLKSSEFIYYKASKSSVNYFRSRL